MEVIKKVHFICVALIFFGCSDHIEKKEFRFNKNSKVSSLNQEDVTYEIVYSKNSHVLETILYSDDRRVYDDESLKHILIELNDSIKDESEIIIPSEKVKIFGVIKNNGSEYKMDSFKSRILLQEKNENTVTIQFIDVLEFTIKYDLSDKIDTLFLSGEQIRFSEAQSTSSNERK